MTNTTSASSAAILSRFEEILLTRHENENAFISDVREGLLSRPKTLPCIYLYDDRGSLLFEEICRLPEYY